MVDSVAVFATPRDTDESIENFNTGRFAEDMIKDVVEAGVDRNKQILFITPIAWGTSSMQASTYSNLICDYGVDPRGNGSFIFPDGSGYYFFSQTRAIEDGDLAK
ncbi:hypothetical protein Pmar_PMAR029078, partial [Perkinsus marinus ATCC 50983]